MRYLGKILTHIVLMGTSLLNRYTDTREYEIEYQMTAKVSESALKIVNSNAT